LTVNFEFALHYKFGGCAETEITYGIIYKTAESQTPKVAAQFPLIYDLATLIFLI
jgi:hypothetical protein